MNLTWFEYSLLSALFASLAALTSKVGLVGCDVYYASFLQRLGATPVVCIFFAMSRHVVPSGDYWKYLLCAVVVSSIATILAGFAVKEGELSLVTPIGLTAPVFLLVLSPLFLGEYTSALGAVGVLFIVVGAYSLNIHVLKTHGILAPFSRLMTAPGARNMLYVAILAAFGMILDRKLVLLSSGVFHSFALNTGLLVVGVAVAVARKIYLSRNKDVITGGELGKKASLVMLASGVFFGLSSVTLSCALETGIAPYASAVKRIGIVLTIIYGFMFFGEKNIRSRLSGALIMLAGVLFITYFGKSY